MPLRILIGVWILILCRAHAGCAETFTDSLGRTVRLDRPPARIIPLAPSLTEILYFLDLGNRVAGVTGDSDYPEEAARKPRVGSYVNLNAEKILSLSPDLVIGTFDGNDPSLVELLDRAGVPVFVVNPRNVSQALDTLRIIGKLCGVESRSEVLFRKLSERLRRVREKIRDRSRPGVFIQLNLKPIMTANGDTFVHDLIELAGGRNLFADAAVPYPRVSLEEVIRRNPEVILIPSMAIGGRFKEARDEWLRWPAISAAGSGRVHLVDADITNRPSPRIVDGLEAVAQVIHPELNWE